MNRLHVEQKSASGQGLPMSRVSRRTDGGQCYVNGCVRDDRWRATADSAQKVGERDKRVEDVARLELVLRRWMGGAWNAGR